VIARRFWPLRDDADAAASAARVPSHDFR
jgi:hypothetical protein